MLRKPIDGPMVLPYHCRGEKLLPAVAWEWRVECLGYDRVQAAGLLWDIIEGRGEAENERAD